VGEDAGAVSLAFRLVQDRLNIDEALTWNIERVAIDVDSDSKALRGCHGQVLQDSGLL
jgi:hypothetical protein